MAGLTLDTIMNLMQSPGAKGSVEVKVFNDNGSVTDDVISVSINGSGQILLHFTTA